jgi:hypothetical protein
MELTGMWTKKRPFPAPSRFVRPLSSITVLLAASAVVAADPPTVKQALGVVPHHNDVEFDVPDPKTLDQCKIAPLQDGKATGWLVLGPAGQPLRRFMDTDGNDVVDQFSFYKNGLEVYRDIISKPNGKKDQFRWLNIGGMRWGIDTNGDGKIDVYKQISAEEVSRLAVRALVTQDAQLLAPLLVTKEDLKQLGIKGTLEAKLLASVADPAARLKKAVAGSKIIQPKSTWLRFDAAPPAAVPADGKQTTNDLVVYENVMAIVDYGNASSPGLVHVGELIRVGEVWKMTSLPVPLEGNAIQLAPGLVLSEPLAGGAGPAAVATDVSPKQQELIDELRKLMENPPAANAAKAVIEKYQKRLEGVLGELISESKTDDERTQWRRQLIDVIAGAVQSGFDDTGIERLKRMRAEIAKEDHKSPLLPMIDIRLINVEYFVAIRKATDNDERAKIHEKWLDGLEEFLDANPKAEDSPENAWQFASNIEFSGKLEKARKWYDRISDNYGDAPAAVRARGALKRIDLVGKPLVLSGTSMAGGTIDAKQFQKKLLCVVFWDTTSKPALEDLPLLKTLYDAHHAQGFEILGVNLDPVKAAVIPVLTQHSAKWPQIHEPGGPESVLAKEFGINSLPTMFIVDVDGKVLNRGASIADLKTTLAEKLGKK